MVTKDQVRVWFNNNKTKVVIGLSATAGAVLGVLGTLYVLDQLPEDGSNEVLESVEPATTDNQIM
jgi:hypothetical protein